MKYLYLLAPILALAFLWGIYSMIQSRPIPEPLVIKHQEEVVWDEAEYWRHQKHKPFTENSVHNLLIKRTRQKAGVYLESLEGAMDTMGLEVVSAYHQVMGDEYVPVITSGNDYPFHVRTSKHYENKAMDFRVVDMPVAKRKELVEILGVRLQNRFRVIWEKGEQEHLHIEMLD